MENYYWILWCILGAVLIVAEIFTSGFVLLWFGIGALAAALVGLIGINSLAIQFAVFALVSVGLTAASRTIFVKYFSRECHFGRFFVCTLADANARRQLQHLLSIRVGTT